MDNKNQDRPDSELDLDHILAENWDDSPEEKVSDHTAVYKPGKGSEKDPWDSYVWKSNEPLGTAHSDPEPEPADGWDSDDDTWEQEEAPEEDEPETSVRKGRPKFRKGYGLLGIPHILATGVWLAIILAIGVSLGRVLWVCTADLMAFGKPDHEVVITIVAEDDIDSVCKKLADAELVRYPNLFKKFATLTGKDERISVGTFTLNAKLDYNAMINAMGSYAPAREEVEVVIPEGANCAQLFKLLEDKKVCSVKDLEDWAANGELKDFWFLENVKRGSKYCLEGFLAPDTYEFYTNDDPGRVLNKILYEFGDRFTDRMKEKFQVLQERYAKNLAAHGMDSAYIEAHALDLNSIVTLASIVERETSSGDESFKMASVFFNRLTNPKNYPHLESKATVHYAVEDFFKEITKLTDTHFASTSPYNTFTCEGLPAGPICNPSVNSIYAVLDPDDTNYYYYVFSKKENKHLFASSAGEHERNVAKVAADEQKD